MSVNKKDLNRLSAFDGDPAVGAALGKLDNVYDRTAKLRKMTPGQRRKAERDAKRPTVAMDIPPETMERLRATAQAEGVSVSGLANLFIQIGLRETEAGRFELSSYKRPTRSPRFDWGLETTLQENGKSHDES